MGKDSLLKSTSKKKGSAKKKGAAKAAPAAKKASAGSRSKNTARPNNAPAKKTGKKIEVAAPRKNAPEKTVAAEAVVAGKNDAARAAAAPAVQRQAAPVKISIRELLREKFEGYAPAAPFQPEKDQRDPRSLTSPPFIAATDPAEAERLKALLLEKLDLKAMTEAAFKAAQAAGGDTPKESALPEATPEPESAPDDPKPEPDEAAPQAAEEMRQTLAPPPDTPVDRSVLEGFGGPEPFSKATILGIVAFVMLVLLIVGASYSNTHKYYLKAQNGALEIWRGAFAPMGQEKLVALPGVQAPREVLQVYGKDDVYPLVFDYYVGQADRLLDAPGLPDFEAIQGYLHQARAFAATPDALKTVRIRIDHIDLFVSRYKAEVSAAKGTVDDMDAAIAYLRGAARLSADEAESAEIAKRIEFFEVQKTRLAQEAAVRQAEIDAAQEEASAAAKAAEVAKEEAGAAQEAAAEVEEQGAKGHGEAAAPEAK